MGQHCLGLGANVGFLLSALVFGLRGGVSRPSLWEGGHGKVGCGILMDHPPTSVFTTRG